MSHSSDKVTDLLACLAVEDDNDRQLVENWIRHSAPRIWDAKWHAFCVMSSYFSYDDFRGAVIPIIRDAAQGTEESLLMSINFCYIMWKLFVTDEKNDPADRLEVFTGAVRTIALYSVIGNALSAHPQSEVFETYLLYEEHLKSELNLVTFGFRHSKRLNSIRTHALPPLPIIREMNRISLQVACDHPMSNSFMEPSEKAQIESAERDAKLEIQRLTNNCPPQHVDNCRQQCQRIFEDCQDHIRQIKIRRLATLISPIQESAAAVFDEDDDDQAIPWSRGAPAPHSNFAPNGYSGPSAAPGGWSGSSAAPPPGPYSNGAPTPYSGTGAYSGVGRSQRGSSLEDLDLLIGDRIDMFFTSVAMANLRLRSIPVWTELIMRTMRDRYIGQFAEDIDDMEDRIAIEFVKLLANPKSSVFVGNNGPQRFAMNVDKILAIYAGHFGLDRVMAIQMLQLDMVSFNSIIYTFIEGRYVVRCHDYQPKLGGHRSRTILNTDSEMPAPAEMNPSFMSYSDEHEVPYVENGRYISLAKFLSAMEQSHHRTPNGETVENITFLIGILSYLFGDRLLEDITPRLLEIVYAVMAAITPMYRFERDVVFVVADSVMAAATDFNIWTGPARALLAAKLGAQTGQSNAARIRCIEEFMRIYHGSRYRQYMDYTHATGRRFAHMGLGEFSAVIDQMMRLVENCPTTESLRTAMIAHGFVDGLFRPSIISETLLSIFGYSCVDRSTVAQFGAGKLIVNRDANPNVLWGFNKGYNETLAPGEMPAPMPVLLEVGPVAMFESRGISTIHRMVEILGIPGQDFNRLDPAAFLPTSDIVYVYPGRGTAPTLATSILTKFISSGHSPSFDRSRPYNLLRRAQIFFGKTCPIFFYEIVDELLNFATEFKSRGMQRMIMVIRHVLSTKFPSIWNGGFSMFGAELLSALLDILPYFAGGSAEKNDNFDMVLSFVRENRIDASDLPNFGGSSNDPEIVYDAVETAIKLVATVDFAMLKYELSSQNPQLAAYHRTTFNLFHDLHGSCEQPGEESFESVPFGFPLGITTFCKIVDEAINVRTNAEISNPPELENEHSSYRALSVIIERGLLIHLAISRAAKNRGEVTGDIQLRSFAGRRAVIDYRRFDHSTWGFEWENDEIRGSESRGAMAAIPMPDAPPAVAPNIFGSFGSIGNSIVRHFR